MTFLGLSLLALVAGPLLYRVVRRQPFALQFLDGFIFVTISGLVVFSILPGAIERGGLVSLLFAAAGLFGPTVLERLYRRQASRTHQAALALGLTAFGLHAVVDGAALTTGTATGTLLLPAAVIIHRLPVGLAIWLLVRPVYGWRLAALILTFVAALTGIGFALGPAASSGFDRQGLVWFEALVAGSLLHVLFHQPHAAHDEDCCAPAEAGGWPQGAGSLLGIVALIGLMSDADHGPALGLIDTELLWELALESAPALLIAYLMAGLIHAFLPISPVRWMGRGSSWNQALRGMAVGLPVPICSCGVVPLYRTLVRQGAAPSAGIAFLIATPELGLDAILISIPLLGGSMTIARVGAAAVVALLVGVIVGRLIPRSAADPARAAPPPAGSLTRRLGAGLRLGLGELVDHTAPWILLGLVVAAAAGPLLSGGQWARLPAVLEIPAFALLGLPVYVCASGATPLVAVLLAGGVSPGAALAFLLTGPATNITTFGLLGALHGRRTALAFSVSVIVLSVSLGFAANAVLGRSIRPPVGDPAGHSASLLQQLSLAALAAIYLWSLLRRGSRRFLEELKFEESVGSTVS